MKISILVITYNHETYIRQALEGIQLQRDMADYEILFCDDQSTDGTVSIAREILSSSEKVSFYINEKNLGITRNYRQAFLKCRGEYIFILEGDDYWIDPYKIKKQVAFLDDHPVCSMCAHPFIVQQDNRQVFDFPKIDFQAGYLLFDGKDLILDEGIISNFSTCCYRRSMLERISSETYETISYEWMINISIAEFGFLAKINEPMSVYRHSANGSWTKIPHEKQLRGIYDILPSYDKILGNRYHVYFERKRGMLNEKLMEFTLPHDAGKNMYSFRRILAFVKRKFS